MGGWESHGEAGGAPSAGHPGCPHPLLPMLVRGAESCQGCPSPSRVGNFGGPEAKGKKSRDGEFSLFPAGTGRSKQSRVRPSGRFPAQLRGAPQTSFNPREEKTLLWAQGQSPQQGKRPCYFFPQPGRFPRPRKQKWSPSRGGKWTTVIFFAAREEGWIPGSPPP